MKKFIIIIGICLLGLPQNASAWLSDHQGPITIEVDCVDGTPYGKLIIRPKTSQFLWNDLTMKFQYKGEIRYSCLMYLIPRLGMKRIGEEAVRLDIYDSRNSKVGSIAADYIKYRGGVYKFVYKMPRNCLMSASRAVIVIKK